MEISQPTQRLIAKYQTWYQSQQLKSGVSTIHVDEVASRVASFYEKMRGVVEWKEEHLLRRAAIERILKRRLILRKINDDTAESFVLELIRGGHFPNDSIPDTKIKEVEGALNKYLYILENSSNKQEEKMKVQLYDWLLGIAACETEEILYSHYRERALIDYMAEVMKERIKVSAGSSFGLSLSVLSDEEKDTQIFIACQRALFKLDPPTITYYLLKRRYPQWAGPETNQLQEIAVNIYSIWKNIEEELNHSLSEKFYKICERYDTLYLIFGDILSQNIAEPKKILAQPETLEAHIRQAYQTRLKKLKARVARAAVFSTISIFVTKMLLAFAIEIPFDKYVLGKFNYQTIGFNIVIPPLLMFLMVMTIRPPRKENLNVVVMELMKIVYKKDVRDVYEIRAPRRRSIILILIINLFYFLTFLFSFGIIVWGLNKLNFGTLSIIIFLMFFSLIAFAGVKIRERAKELQVLPDKGGLFTFLTESFSLPFLRMGRWLSKQWMKYNVILVLITAFIDMPFQVFVEFLEQWRGFLKEKKEEIH
jgi:hypothetical protein